MKSASQIDDGVYFLHPDGCGWEAAIVRHGRITGRTSEDVQATHDAAHDGLAGIAPEETDIEVSRKVAESLIAEVIPESSPEQVVVTMRPPN